MGRVWLMSQSIQKKNVESLQPRKRRVRNAAEVGEIGGRTKTVAENFRLAMDHRYGLELRAKKIELPLDRLEFQPRQPAKLIVRVENVAEHIADVLRCFGARIKRNPALVVIAQGAKIVDAEDVVGVTVGVDHGIDLRNLLADRLFAEVGC